MSDISDWDPYEELMAVIKFCHATDNHIATLIANQETIINQLNQLREDLSTVEMKLLDIEIAEILDDKKN